MNKLGRPTESRKEIVVRARIDEETNHQLEICIDKLELTKSEVIREGILKLYAELMMENK